MGRGEPGARSRPSNLAPGRSAETAPARAGAMGDPRGADGGPPTVDDILEATAASALRYTHADRGHAYLVARDESGLDVVTHQCLVHADGTIVRQYERRRRLVPGPCQEAIREGRMYYVHDAATNRLHRDLLRALAVREKALADEGDPLRLAYVQQYRAFLAPAKSYIAVPIKRPGGEPVGCVALYSTEREDFFGVMKKRIIEEYLDHFANALIVALIDKARGAEPRRESPRVFDDADASPWDGTGPYLERILREHLRRGSWNGALTEIERWLMELALRHAGGRPTAAHQLLRMPRRTFFTKLKKYGLDATSPLAAAPPPPGAPDDGED